MGVIFCVYVVYVIVFLLVGIIFVLRCIFGVLYLFCFEIFLGVCCSVFCYL